jgi:hypothetical protein
MVFQKTKKTYDGYKKTMDQIESRIENMIKRAQSGVTYDQKVEIVRKLEIERERLTRTNQMVITYVKKLNEKSEDFMRRINKK